MIIKTKKTSKKGLEFEVEVEWTKEVKGEYGYYRSDLEIKNAWIDGHEFPKDKYGRLWYMGIEYAYDGVEKVLCFCLRDEALKFFMNHSQLNKKLKYAYIKASQDFVEFYDQYEKEKNNLIKRAEEEYLQKLKSEFKNLDNNEMVKLHYHTSYGYSFKYDVVKEIERSLKNLKKTDIDLKKYLTDTDMGDYSISYTYHIPAGELKEILARADKIINGEEIQKAKDKLPKLKEGLEKWETSSLQDVARVIYTGSVHVDENGYFSDCPDYCDDCFFYQHFTKDVIDIVKGVAETFYVKNKSRTYTYYAVDQKAIDKIVSIKKKDISAAKEKKVKELKAKIAEIEKLCV